MRPKIILTSLISAGLLIGALVSYTKQPATHQVLATTTNKTLTSAAPTTDVVTVIGDSVFDPEIITRLNELIAGHPELDIAVSLIDLETGSQFDAGLSGAHFKAASTAKVLTAAAYLYEVQQGQASLDETIDGMPVLQLLRRSIEVSDNDAWDSLRNYLGNKQQAFAELLALDSYVGGDLNIVTASDQARLLAKLSAGDILASTYTSILFESMAKANAPELIPAALPDEAVVLHKYGELWGNLHDIALVKYQGQRFALAIFTNNPAGTISDYSSRAALIREITATVFGSMLQYDMRSASS